jgi:hypothetical protein
MVKQPKKNFLVLLPILGVLVFIGLYILATLYYPGGSNFNSTSIGFDWFKNYWCDLTMRIAKNGELNIARPIALTAMFVLCISLGIFWLYLPTMFENYKYHRSISYVGICSMMITFFLFTKLHDLVINVAGALGIIALTITFIGLYQNKLFRHFTYGLFCMIFMLFNYWIYETGELIIFQPIIQKINFIFFLSWICWMDILLYRRIISNIKYD